MKLTRKKIRMIALTLLIFISGVLLVRLSHHDVVTRTLTGDEYPTEETESEEQAETDIEPDTEPPADTNVREAEDAQAEEIETETEQVPGEEPEEESEEESEKIRQAIPNATIIDSTSIVVYSYSALQNALENNNGYTHIYLGDNIVMTGGITVSSSKASFTISGIDPLNPGAGRHTLTEFSSAAIEGTIYIYNATTMTAALRDLIIIGKNFFGTIGVSTLYSADITYENIDYTGPQIAYNINGTCRFIDCVIDVTTRNGGPTIIEELCQTHHVVFGGSVTVTGTTTTTSMMWFFGTDGTLTVLDNADVRFDVPNNYLMFSNAGTVSCSIGRGASFIVYSKYGLFYNNSLTLHQFNTLSIGENATFEVYQAARNIVVLTPTIKVYSNMTVAPGARVIVSAMHTSADPLIRFYTNGAGAVLTDPAAVVLTNKTGKLFDWSTGSGTINITADTVCYWSAAYSASESSGFARMPTRYWHKRPEGLLNIRATLSSSTMTGVTTDFTPVVDSGGEAPSTTSFNLISAHMLSFGRLPLSLDSPAADSGILSGETLPYAELRLEHSAFDTIYAASGSGGLIYVPIPLLDYPGTINVTAQSGLLFKNADADVLPPQTEKILAFEHVPTHMQFGVVPITAHAELHTRESPEWTIILTDTRDYGAVWSLYVRSSSPLTHESGDVLPSAIAYIDPAGEAHSLGEDMIKAASGVKDMPEHTVRVNWTQTEGIALQIPPSRSLKGRYTAAIEWILVDGP